MFAFIWNRNGNLVLQRITRRLSSISPAVLLGGVLLAAACGTATLPRPALAAGAPFAALTGAWGGNGTIQPGNGTTERIRCNANYRPRGSSGSRDRSRAALRQRQLQFRPDRPVLRRRRQPITGQWTERTRNIGGSVIGTVRGESLQVHVESSGFAADLVDVDARPSPECDHRFAGRRTNRKASITLSRR